MSLVNRFLDWIRSLFWKEEMELTLVGLQNSGKTTFVNVIAVSISLSVLKFFFFHNSPCSFSFFFIFYPTYVEWTIHGGHDPDRWIQHAKDNQGKCDNQGMRPESINQSTNQSINRAVSESFAFPVGNSHPTILLIVLTCSKRLVSLI